MAEPAVSQRLQRPLAVVAVVLLLAGIVAAALSASRDDGVAPAEGAAGRGGTDIDDRFDTGPGPAGEDAGGDAGTTTSTALAPDVPPSTVAVPEPGVYRYTVERTRDGTAETFEEVRALEVLDTTDGATRVQLEVTTEGQRQVSVLEWSPSQVLVRSTRVPTASGPGSDCTWEPPIVEFGLLVEGETWEVASSCTADVAGVPSTFAVTGSGRVLGEVEILVGDREHRVWRIERTRTTVITAEIAGDPVEQRVEERGDLYVDPQRGIVVLAEATLTRTGAQEGTTRRTSSLIG